METSRSSAKFPSVLSRRKTIGEKETEKRNQYFWQESIISSM